VNETWSGSGGGAGICIRRRSEKSMGMERKHTEIASGGVAGSGNDGGEVI
jgi:hypothetical protein